MSALTLTALASRKKQKAALSRTDILSAGADIPDIPMSPGHPMRQVGLPRRIGLIFMVYKAPADRISVRDRAAFCFFREASAVSVSADTGLDPGGIGIGFKIWALPEIRAKPVFVWRGNV